VNKRFRCGCKQNYRTKIKTDSCDCEQDIDHEDAIGNRIQKAVTLYSDTMINYEGKLYSTLKN